LKFNWDSDGKAQKESSKDRTILYPHLQCYPIIIIYIKY